MLRKQSRELAICQQLANGSKHFILDNKYNDATVSSYRSASVSLYLSDDGRSRAVSTHGVFIADDDRTYADAVMAVKRAVLEHGELVGLRVTGTNAESLDRLNELDPDGEWSSYSGSVHPDPS